MDRKTRQARPDLQMNRRNRGSSLPLIMCVGAFLIAFSLALMYTAGLLLSTPDKKVEKERCYQLASTFAKELERDLKDKSKEHEAKSFRSFANNFLNSSAYNEYNPDNPSTVYHYIADGQADNTYGRIKLRLYKELNEDESGSLEGTLEASSNEDADFTEEVAKYESKTFQRYIFTVEVIAEWKDMSYNYATEYFRVDTYNVSFFHNHNGEDTEIVWDKEEHCWKKGTTAGEIYTAWKDSDTPIRYRYAVNELKDGEYRNVHAEADTDGQGGG